MVEHSKQVKSAGRPKPPAAGMGRKKGTPNKVTARIKEAVIMAAEEEGEDGAGKDGLKGYCRTLAREEKKAFATLLGKILPTQITGEDGGPVEVLTKTQRDAAVAAAIRADS